MMYVKLLEGEKLLRKRQLGAAHPNVGCSRNSQVVSKLELNH